jgi:glucokinase
MSGLIADIGGTNVRFARVADDGAISSVEPMKVADYPTLVDACEAYLAGAGAVPGGPRPRHGAFAVASPVLGDQVQMTNHRWVFSIEETRRSLGLDTLDVVNDFAAVALGLPFLTRADVVRIGGGEPDPHAPLAVLGAGTGLGMAGLVRPRGGGYVPLTSEGGHVTMPAFNDREAAVLAALRGDFEGGHVSAERVVSGPGLVNLYRAIAEVDGALADASITPADCTARAAARSCPISMEAVAMFCAMLGTIASDLALTLDARGGIFIGGGIAPKMGEQFIRSGFRARFEDKGRFGGYLARIPTSLITRPLPAFTGLAALVATP